MTRMSWARRDQRGDPHQLLHRPDVGEVVGGRRHVVHAVGVGDVLGVGHVLEELLGAAVEVADDRLPSMIRSPSTLSIRRSTPWVEGC